MLAIFISHCPAFRLGSLGGLGVSCFILMSGYLTAMKYYDSGIPSASGLFVRRLRTYFPMHILTLICSLILSYREAWTLRRGATLFLNTFLLQAYVPVSWVYFSFNGVSWYLSLTMFFVLISPLMLKMLHRIDSRSLTLKATVFILILQLIICAASELVPQEFQHWVVYVSPFIRSIDFLLGGLVFLFIREHELYRGKLTALFFAAVGVEAIFALLSRGKSSEFFSVSAWTLLNVIIIACLVLHEGTNSFVDNIFSNRLAVFIGNISFEFFILHGIVKAVTSKIFSKIFHVELAVPEYISALLLTVFSAYVCNKIWHRLREGKIQ